MIRWRVLFSCVITMGDVLSPLFNKNYFSHRLFVLTTHFIPINLMLVLRVLILHIRIYDNVDEPV